MTKFMLVLHLCSVVAMKCTDATYTGLMFDDHYTCALGGYRMGYETFKRLETDDYDNIAEKRDDDERASRRSQRAAQESAQPEDGVTDFRVGAGSGHQRRHPTFVEHRQGHADIEQAQRG